MAKSYTTKFLLSCTALFVGIVSLGLPWRNAWASDSQGKYIIYGKGGETCSLAFDNNDAASSLSAIHWLMGYLTAGNLWQPETYEIVTLTSVQKLQWIRDYCRLNPTTKLVYAAVAMVETFYPTRQIKEPTVRLPQTPAAQAPTRAPATNGNGDQTEHVLRILKVQARLQAAGYDPGPLDGSYGPYTRDALRLFQLHKGLNSTGEIDAATLHALSMQ